MDDARMVTITVRRSTLVTALSALTVLSRQFEKERNVSQVMAAYAELHEATRKTL